MGPRRWLELAATVIVCAALAAWFLNRRPAAPDSPETWLAEITQLRGVVTTGDADWRVGQQFAPGLLALAAGAMELTLNNGVRVLIEGPAELELFAPLRVALHAGQAVVRVPENAKGFQLDAPDAKVVDLGTEFGVKIGPGGVTDVLVFEGAVMASAARGSGAFPHHLKAGKAARFSPDRVQPEEIAYRPERFVRRLPADRGIAMADSNFPFNQPAVEEVAVFPAGPPIEVDGDLSEWSADGLFRGVRGAGHFVEGRMRYDTDFLYVAAHIGDPAPLRNVVDPATDGEFGWRGGGLQIRVAADPSLGWPVNANAAEYYQLRHLPVDAAQFAQATNAALVHLTLWQYARDGRNCLHLAYGMDFHGAVVDPPGFRGAMRATADGRGYQLEYAIPWRLLNAARAPRPGETLGMSWTVHWSDESGRLWRGQHVEIRNQAEPLRIHTWERAATWGRAHFQ